MTRTHQGLTRCRLLLLSAAVSVVVVVGSPSAQTTRLTPWLETALRQEGPGARHLVWIYLRDKGPDAGARLQSTTVNSSARARVRRTARGTARMPTIEDLGVAPEY